MNKQIQVTQSSMPNMEEYIEEVKDLWDSRWLTNNGNKHQILEEKLQRYLGIEHISLFTNGHSALEMTIESFNLSGEVITTPFTFASTSHAIIRNNLTPVFCDISPVDYTIDINKIESLITNKTSAIIPVHVYGNVCDVYAIEKIAKKYNLKVIYDAAHVFGVTVDGRGIGNFGDASMFSFHATKVFNTIEGGAVTFKDKELNRKLNLLKNFGITGPETIEGIGGNAKMSEFQAAMGLCNLRNINNEIEKRKKVNERYYENLENVDGIKLMKFQKGVKHNYSYLPVLFNEYPLKRDEIHKKLKEIGIMTRKYFYPTMNTLKCYKDKFKLHETPVAKFISENILTLPLYADLSLEDVDQICRTIISFSSIKRLKVYDRSKTHRASSEKRAVL